jgi:hypothetical protein
MTSYVNLLKTADSIFYIFCSIHPNKNSLDYGVRIAPKSGLFCQVFQFIGITKCN